MISKASANKAGHVNKPSNSNGFIGLELTKMWSYLKSDYSKGKERDSSYAFESS